MLKELKEQNLIDDKEMKFLWVTDFPLFDYDEENKLFHAMHHPFTSPHKDDLELLNTNPKLVRANAYDMSLNGTEIGGGSIRIHNRELQNQIFNILGFSDQESSDKFGFLMEAFEYGAPPHGGIAPGIDRMVMLLANEKNIREVTMFPMNQNAQDLMMKAPSSVSDEQLKELGIYLKKK